MGQALYRKYRPKKLKEVVGQEHITNTLKNSIDSGSLSHAYLLTGPRGVGKTSIARILAHEINKLNYDESANHLDIIEIDAASNRRIDEIRELRDKVNILPSVVDYKVYIIDEVHMLTREAFNALLKTLEEPPKHAIFILATTEVHKLPETIISRTQHFSFKPIDEASLAKHLKYIAKQEGIKIDDDALELISIHGDGSFRDSISLLDQTASSKADINADLVQTMLGLAPKKTITKIVDELTTTTPKELINTISQLKDQGVQTGVLSKQLAELLRSRIISDPNFQQDKYLKLLEAIINVSSSVNPSKQLEIELLSFVIANTNQAGGSSPTAPATVVPEAPTTPSPTPAQKVEHPKPLASAEIKSEEKPEPKPQPKAEDKPKSKETNEVQPEPPAATGSGVMDEQAWNNVLGELKKKYNTLFGVLKMAKVSVDGDKINLAFKFPFHKKKIDDQKNKSVIDKIVRSQTGVNYTISTTVVSESKDSKSDEAKKTNSVSNVSDIFGGAELLES